MALPPLGIAFVMYATAVGSLWVAVRILAPAGYEFSLLRGLGAAILMTIASKALRIYLSPLIGDWYAVVTLITYVLVVKIVLSLPFWRSIPVALIYFAVVAAVYYFLFTRTA